MNYNFRDYIERKEIIDGTYAAFIKELFPIIKSVKMCHETHDNKEWVEIEFEGENYKVYNFNLLYGFIEENFSIRMFPSVLINLTSSIMEYCNYYYYLLDNKWEIKR